MPDARNTGSGLTRVEQDGAAGSKRRTTNGKKVVDGAHVVFEASVAYTVEPTSPDQREVYVVNGFYADKTEAFEAAQGDLLKPNATIRGVVFVPWGENVQKAIAAAILAARATS